MTLPFTTNEAIALASVALVFSGLTFSATWIWMTDRVEAAKRAARIAESSALHHRSRAAYYRALWEKRSSAHFARQAVAAKTEALAAEVGTV